MKDQFGLGYKDVPGARRFRVSVLDVAACGYALDSSGAIQLAKDAKLLPESRTVTCVELKEECGEVVRIQEEMPAPGGNVATELFNGEPEAEAPVPGSVGPFDNL